jgi:hypothetical protein
MRLWYQSISRRTEWGVHSRVLHGILNKVRDQVERGATTFDCGDFGQ